MRRRLSFAIAATVVAALAAGHAASAAAAVRHPKTQITVRPGKGVGFLPGYRSPEQIARDARRQGEYHPHYWYWGGRYYIGAPGYFRGRWNGGSFGPCYKWTPIGPMWSCG